MTISTESPELQRAADRARRHEEAVEATMPAPFARVIEALTRTNFGSSKTEVALSSNPDIHYLALKAGYTEAFVNHITRVFGADVVVEALRQCAGRGAIPAYAHAVCRRLTAEEAWMS